MATHYAVFDSTPANIVADLKTQILLSTDWSNPTGSVVTATTTRGAQMVVDLADAAATSNRLQLGVYRTWSGGVGTDKLTRYLTYNSVTPATTTVLHCIVSVGKEHCFFSIEGPRGGETGAENSSDGSPRQMFGLFDIVPYFSGDATPAVALVSHNTQANGDGTYTLYVSRDQDNTTSWVAANTVTLCNMPRTYQLSGNTFYSSLQPIARGDGNYYVWPYVVIEQANGIRGRLNKIYWAGNVTNQNPVEWVPIIGTKITYNSEGYTLNILERTAFQYDAACPLGTTDRINNLSGVTLGSAPGNSQVIAIPNGL